MLASRVSEQTHEWKPGYGGEVMVNEDGKTFTRHRRLPARLGCAADFRPKLFMN